MSNSPYKGVFSAVVTALNEDKSPDLDTMAAHCKYLLANGCDGLAVLGTTGEANSFGLKERNCHHRRFGLSAVCAGRRHDAGYRMLRSN